MSDAPDETPQAVGGPEIPDAVDEVRGQFASGAALEDAIGRLSRAGFDRAELSIPRPDTAPALQTPEQGAEAPNTADDAQQTRTLHASMAGSVGALAAAGVVVASGGAALPAVAAAAAAGLGAGGLMEFATRAGDALVQARHESDAARGELVLAVRVRTPERRAIAEQLMRDAGAVNAGLIHRSDRRTRDDIPSPPAGTDSRGWTG